MSVRAVAAAVAGLLLALLLAGCGSLPFARRADTEAA